MYRYKLIVTGGTFDHFHAGHEAFLRFAFSQSEHVLIGITSDAFIKEKSSAGSLEPYAIRKAALMRFLQQEHLEQRVEVEQIENADIAPIWKDLPIEAVLVTENTSGGGEYINQKRAEEGKPQLTILTVPLVIASDTQPISSTRIRNGVIDRGGKSYVTETFLQKTMVLPDEMRATLQQPFGELMQLTSFDFTSVPIEQVITVGDVTTHAFLAKDLHPRLAIIDFFVEREKKYSSFKEIGFTGTEHVFHAVNPPGQLTPSLMQTIQKIFSNNGMNNVLSVEGEEDLSVLPVLLFAPLTYHIFYGQPHEGAVHIVVTEEKKEAAFNMLAQFIVA